MVFAANGCCQVAQPSGEVIALLGRNRRGRERLAWNRISQSTPLHARQLQTESLSRLLQDAIHQLVGVASSQMDIHAGVATFQSLDRELDPQGVFSGGLPGDRQFGRDVHSAGTANREDMIFLGIKVQQDAALQPTGRERFGSGHSGLFIDRKQGLDRRMLQLTAGQDRHDAGHADTVVGSQRGPAGFDPVPFDEHVDSLRVEIEVRIGILLPDHVEVGLQDHGWTVFPARCGRLANQHIANPIDFGRQPQPLTKLPHELGDAALILGRAGNGIQVGKGRPQVERFQRADGSHEDLWKKDCKEFLSTGGGPEPPPAFRL